MCTAISFYSKDHYFGRTLDLEYSYQESVVVTPRNFPMYFKTAIPLLSHYAFIGMATLANNYPLYYDGTNEYGLSIAGLNFVGSAVYQDVKENSINIAHFELIPWVLGSFKSVREFTQKAKNLNITNLAFSAEYPTASLHWIISDSECSVVIESTESGLHIYENPFQVLTNDPPFPYQTDNLKQYLSLTNRELISNLPYIKSDTRGTGSLGLPGDLTSKSRFVRAFFTKQYSVCKDSESASVSQFFHILDAVSQTQGCVIAGSQYVKTVYTSCCNADKGIYYYKTYENSQITGIRLKNHDLEGASLSQYVLIRKQQFRMEN